MNPPRANINAGYDEDKGSVVQQLEITVLGQIRDNMAIMNQNMAKLNDKVDNTNDLVIALKSANYDERIKKLETDAATDLARVDTNLQRQLTEAQTNIGQLFTRCNNLALQAARLGLGMAIASTVAGVALGSIVAFIMSRVLGGHV